MGKNNLPTVPEYFKAYVDPTIDLDITHNIPCPFHHEKSGKSFTYSPEKQIWRCWGACHTGGGIIELHQLNYKIRTKEDAKRSLYKLLGMEEELLPKFEKQEVHVDETDVKRRVAYAKALKCATTPDDWLKLDYILSQVPYDIGDLNNFIFEKEQEKQNETVR